MDPEFDIGFATDFKLLNVDDLVKTMENLHNVLIVIKTKYNHVFSIFIPNIIFPNIKNHPLKGNFYLYLVRSQFTSADSYEYTCPKQYINLAKTIDSRTTMTGDAIQFGNIIMIYGDSLINCDGTELCGGPKWSTTMTNVRADQIEIYQIYCS
eukprot:UN04495